MRAGAALPFQMSARAMRYGLSAACAASWFVAGVAVYPPRPLQEAYPVFWAVGGPNVTAFDHMHSGQMQTIGKQRSSLL